MRELGYRRPIHQEKTYGRVLAKPKLLVNDNEQGKLDAKDITYVETTSALPVASGLYYIHISMPDLGEERVLRLAIVAETQFLDRI